MRTILGILLYCSFKNISGYSSRKSLRDFFWYFLEKPSGIPQEIYSNNLPEFSSGRCLGIPLKFFTKLKTIEIKNENFEIFLGISLKIHPGLPLKLSLRFFSGNFSGNCLGFSSEISKGNLLRISLGIPLEIRLRSPLRIPP